MENIKLQIQSLQESVSVLEGKINLLVSQVEQSGKKRENLVNSLDVLNTTQREKENVISELNYLETVFSPKGIRSYLLLQDIQFLNEQLEKLSPYCFSDSIIQIDPGLDENGRATKIGIQLISSAGIVLDYSDCSGGECRRIDLAIELAKRELLMFILGTSTNLLVVDEVFESIDGEGIWNVLNLFQDCYSDLCTYVVSHINDLPFEFFTSELLLMKRDGIANIISRDMKTI